jgi:L-ascorbate metabolism protein UlaG (beta-lactamase superfamily)
MSITITWLGHAAFSLTDGTDTVLIDPWLTGNPAASTTAEEVEATLIAVSHGHLDHLGDAAAISRRTGAPIVAINELATHVGRTESVEVLAANFGGTVTVGGASVKLVPAMHTSAIDDGTQILASTPAAGVVVRLGGVTVYHAGDTALFGDMTLIGDEGLDVAILPIGGTYTMGPADAARAVGFLHPRIVIPNHFNTFPQLQQDPQELVRDLHDHAEVRILQPGQSTTV